MTLIEPVMAGIKFGQTFYFNNDIGETSQENDAEGNLIEVLNVIQVVDGTIEEILHLIGYHYDVVQHLLVDNVLRAADETNKSLTELTIQAPGAFIIEENGFLFGVIIDKHKKLSLAGVIRSIFKPKYNDLALVIDKEGFEDSNIKDYSIKKWLREGGLYGIVTNGGYMFVQTNEPKKDDFAQLTLMINQTYFLFNKNNVVWSRTDPSTLEIESEKLSSKDCLLINQGACLWTAHGFEILGNGNLVIDFHHLETFNCASHDSVEKAQLIKKIHVKGNRILFASDSDSDDEGKVNSKSDDEEVLDDNQSKGIVCLDQSEEIETDSF